MKPYRVMLGRFVVQTAVLDVDAASEASAVRKALKGARTLSPSNWSGQFDPRRYAIHVHDIFGPEEEEDFIGLEADDDFGNDIRYVLLRANIETGQGSVVPQPWLGRESGLTEADLCADWIRHLELLQTEGLKSFCDWLLEE